ncbi:ABC transporter ATP-binding protein [Oenococcus sp. UCMA 16435]|nr:ABC transporter ATP-binding protein [Oenococcus sp. UCMA 16435]MDN6967034.1 ABC transporter ATP-binding protein [Oenococcus sp. UCMA 17063]
MTAILNATKLTKIYDKKIAVDNIDINIKAGSLVAFLGPNGAGKSTTIKMLTTILRPSKGKILVDGKANPEEIRKNIGIVFQESVLDQELTVKENLFSRLRLYRRLPKNRVDEVIGIVQAQEFQDQRYGALSGGQKRRVDIARALLNRPKILFLDEPTTGLDIQTRTLIWKTLSLMQKNENLTIFLTTHYLEEADQADDVYIIDHGHLIAHGTSDQLKQKYTKNVLTIKGDSNFIKKNLPLGIKLHESEGTLIIDINSSQEAISLLSKYSKQVDRFEFRQGTIDDVFISLTGKEIR